MAETDLDLAQGCLFLAAIGVGFGLACSLVVDAAPILPSIGAGLIAAILYTILAAAIVGVCEKLAKWGFPERAASGQSWNRETKAFVGSIWPLSLLFWLVVSPFFVIINRAFRD